MFTIPIIVTQVFTINDFSTNGLINGLINARLSGANPAVNANPAANQDLTQNSLGQNSPRRNDPKAKQALPFSNRYLWTAMLLLLISTAQAQQTVGGLTQIVEQIKLIANVLFIGAIVWAAVRTVLAFASGSPSAMSNAIQTILIAVFWFGFNYFVSDVASSLGGSGAGDYSGR